MPNWFRKLFNIANVNFKDSVLTEDKSDVIEIRNLTELVAELL